MRFSYCSTMLKKNFCIFFWRARVCGPYFAKDVATPLQKMSPMYDFLGMSEFELSAAVLASGRDNNLATHPPHAKTCLIVECELGDGPELAALRPYPRGIVQNPARIPIKLLRIEQIPDDDDLLVFVALPLELVGYPGEELFALPLQLLQLLLAELLGLELRVVRLALHLELGPRHAHHLKRVGYSLLVAVLRIRGCLSRIRIFPSRKNLSIFNQKNCFPKLSAE
jgi:hypothetical protein